MKIFPTQSIKELDAYTIENEPVASIDLMERASQALTKAITKRWEVETPVTVFAGPGNNGGDALAVSRLLAEKGYQVSVYLFNTKGELSPDCRLSVTSARTILALILKVFSSPINPEGTTGGCEECGFS